MGTNITWLWVSAVSFAHVFATFWLVKTLLLSDPHVLSLCWRRKRPSQRSSRSARKAGAPQPRQAGRAAQHGRPGGASGIGAAQAGAFAVHIPRVAASSRNSSPSHRSEADRPFSPSAASASQFSLPPSDGLYEDDAGASMVPYMHVERLALEWQRIGCSYRSAAGPKAVLHDALLGPSGAGKSTLMDILAQRKSVGSLTGQLLVGGRPVARGFIRRTAYVPQEDNFVPTMTTMETMRFYAAIMLPGSMGRTGRQERIEEVLSALGLGHHHRTLVGGVLPGGLMLRGLSGGERKRLSIAAGIMAAPSVVFLDEPTSGLDSFSALTVMGYVKRTARCNGQVVVASIHQPRSAIWLMFDTVTLLASGRLMYTGPRDGMAEWFGSRGYRYDPALHGVASDWALDLVAVGFHKPKRYYGHTMRTRQQLLAASAAFVVQYRMEQAAGGGGGGRGGGRRCPGGSCSGGSCGCSYSGSCSEFGSPGGSRAFRPASPSASASTSAASRRGAATPRGEEQQRLPPAPRPAWASGWWAQYAACLGRELLAVTRNPADVAGRTLTFSWVALLMGLLYFDMPLDASSLRGRLNLLFNGLVFYCLMPYVSMSLYTADKQFYLADASAKLYRPLAYYAAKATATIPFQVLSSLTFTYTVYGMAGMRHGLVHIAKNGLICSLMYIIAVQVLHCCALLAPNQDAAFMFSILWSTVQLLMSNFFITFNDLRFKWLSQLRWLSALYYAFEGLARTEFGDARFDCSGGVDPTAVTFLKQLLPNSKALGMSAVTNALLHPGASCVADTNALLDYYRFWRPFYETAYILAAYYAGTHVVTFVVMVLVARSERR